jgi:hypothetical protein
MSEQSLDVISSWCAAPYLGEFHLHHDGYRPDFQSLTSPERRSIDNACASLFEQDNYHLDDQEYTV